MAAAGALGWLGALVFGAAGGAAGAVAVNAAKGSPAPAPAPATPAAPPAPPQLPAGVHGIDVDDLGAGPGGEGNWTPATNEDVKRDNVVAAYKALLTRPVGTPSIRVYNGRVWRLKVVSKTTDPDFTKHEKDVRGWVWTCPAPAPAAEEHPEDEDNASGSGGDELAGVSYLPDDCGFALPVRTVADATKFGITLRETPTGWAIPIRQLPAPAPAGAPPALPAAKAGTQGAPSDHTVEDWANALTAGGAGVLNWFAPGSGELVKQAQKKISAKVSKETGHKTREDEAAEAKTAEAKGKVNGMSESNDLVSGPAPMRTTPGHLPGKPSPYDYGAVPGAAGGYLFPAVGSDGKIAVKGGRRIAKAAAIKQFQAAMANWTKRDNKYRANRARHAQGTKAQQDQATLRHLRAQLRAQAAQIAVLQMGGGIDESPPDEAFDDDGFFADDDDDQDDFSGAPGGGGDGETTVDDLGKVVHHTGPAHRHGHQRPHPDNRDAVIHVLASQLHTGRVDLAALEHAMAQAGHIVEKATRHKERELTVLRSAHADGVSGAGGPPPPPPPPPTNLGGEDMGYGHPGGTRPPRALPMGRRDDRRVRRLEVVQSAPVYETEYVEDDDFAGARGGAPGIPPPPNDDDMAGADCGCPSSAAAG